MGRGGNGKANEESDLAPKTKAFLAKKRKEKKKQKKKKKKKNSSVELSFICIMPWSEGWILT